jgi:acetylornithine deacetylase/succinyl-diaminopimelate desuccinylase-like protein
MIRALRVLEAELNAAPPPPYELFEHPIALNVGSIHGGDWPSTVPGECVTEFRIALYPGMRVRDLQDRVEAVIAEAAAADPVMPAHPPEVVYRGFACEGYELAADSPSSSRWRVLTFVRLGTACARSDDRYDGRQDLRAVRRGAFGVLRSLRRAFPRR